eukprot:5789227-Pyramimonas_sp.AAC.1
MEDDNQHTTPSGRRRYPKTGGFRKAMTATGSILVHVSLKLVKLSDKECLSDDAHSATSLVSAKSIVPVHDAPVDTRSALL